MKKVTAAIFAFGFLVTLSKGTWALEEAAPADAGVAGGEDVSLDAGVAEGNGASSDAGVAGDGGVSTAPVAIDATVTIISPEEGATVEGPWVEVSFQVQGCQVNSPSQGPEDCHLHKLVDGANYSDPEGGGLGQYNPTPFQVHIGSAGSHEIGLILVRNDGTDLPFEPEVSDSVTINVEIEAPPPEDGDEEEEEGDEEYSAPVRENSDGGCGCDASKSSATNGTLVMLFCVGLFIFRRRRLY